MSNFVHFGTNLAFYRRKALLAASVVAAVGMFSGAAHAATITFSTPSGSSDTDGPVSGSAAFMTGAGQISITLTDTLAPSLFHSQGQALSDLIFTLSNAPGTQGALSATGQEEDVNPTTGAVTFVSGSPSRLVGQGPPPPNGSGTFNVSGNTITLEALGGGQPSEMILPFEANGADFPGTLDSGITNFDPYTDGSAQITLNFSGITADTTVTAASFSFGTGPEITIAGTSGPGGPPPPVPEPLTLSLFGAGLAGLVAMRRRRKATA
jgi:hypothetical protein